MIDDKLILDQKHSCSDPMGFLFGGIPVPRTKIYLEKEREYKVQISTAPPVRSGNGDVGFLQGQVGVRVGCMPATKHDADILSEAVHLARNSDYSIVFTGNDPSWETEGQDQASFDLPRDGSQNNLVSAVAAVCQRTIVVNSTGCAVSLPWLDEVDALLQTWFPGQEAGHSIVDILTGVRNPEGHLACTFPKRIEDCPAYGNFPGQKHPEHGLEVKYDEGVFVGYRHFDRLPQEKVNFPFGFGLSYTTFDIKDMSVEERSSESFLVKINVSNTGSIKGALAVQVYVGPEAPGPEDPIKTLVAFSKITLDSSSSEVMEFQVQARDFASWDEQRHMWVVRGGNYVFTVGKSSADPTVSSLIAVGQQTLAP